MESSQTPWTNEKHHRFLNSLEASFVRTMFYKNDNARLDRYLPDSSDSTLDLKSHRIMNKNHPPAAAAAAADIFVRRVDGNRPDKRTRRSAHLQDQVVPHNLRTKL